MALSDDEIAVLRFEDTHPQLGAAKNEAIRSQLGLSPVRYYQKLTRLTDSVEALQWDPVLVHRLRRMRDQHIRDRHDRAAPR